MNDAASSATPALKKTLGPIMIWGLGVGYVISGSYFGWNLGLPEGGPLGMLAAAGLVTVLYVCFVLGYAELSCALPRAGGAFVYTQRAFGPTVGFVGGIAQIIEYVFAPPAIALSVGSYINGTVKGPEWVVPAVALGTYVLFTLINILGVTLSATFELVLTVLAVIELLVFGAITLPKFSWESFSMDALPHGPLGAFFAMPFAIWFYLAIEGIANVAEEAKDPQRDLPRGFISAMATLVVLASIALFGAVGAGGWHTVVYPDPSNTEVTSDSPLPLAVRHLFNDTHPLYFLVSGVGLLGLLASCHGILLAAGRAILEMGRSGFLPKALGGVHPRFGTPVPALLANLFVGALALWTGRTGDIILISVFGALTLYALSTLALFRLRKTEPELPRPFHTPGYPFVPGIALSLVVICIVAMVITHPVLSAIYVGTLALATVVFRALRRSNSPGSVAA